MKEKTSVWNAAEHLKINVYIVVYMEADLEENDPGLIAEELGDIVRAEGMAGIAKKIG
jgi:probable addiction module antidote protein